MVQCRGTKPQYPATGVNSSLAQYNKRPSTSWVCNCSDVLSGSFSDDSSNTALTATTTINIHTQVQENVALDAVEGNHQHHWKCTHYSWVQIPAIEVRVELWHDFPTFANYILLEMFFWNPLSLCCFLSSQKKINPSKRRTSLQIRTCRGIYLPTGHFTWRSTCKHEKGL